MFRRESRLAKIEHRVTKVSLKLFIHELIYTNSFFCINFTDRRKYVKI